MLRHGDLYASADAEALWSSHAQALLSSPYPTATGVWNCAFSSYIYCACLQESFFSPHTHFPTHGVSTVWHCTSSTVGLHREHGSSHCWRRESEPVCLLSVETRWLLVPSPFWRSLGGATGPAALSQCSVPQLGKPLTQKHRTTPTLWSCDWWTAMYKWTSSLRCVNRLPYNMYQMVLSTNKRE